mmetsp:Transcript_27637/g.92461  ORF Transcript_27637/g.92461 Transcript_27637/m.92461 type:complete len:268 (+) Transcript_27637:67-870(+)
MVSPAPPYVVTTAGVLTALYMVGITAFGAYLDSRLASKAHEVSLLLPDGRSFRLRCQSRQPPVRLDVTSLSEDGRFCTQLCLPNSAKYLAQAARAGAAFGSNCGQLGCVDRLSPAVADASQTDGVERFTFMCDTPVNGAPEHDGPAAHKPMHLVDCARFGALTTDELTRAARTEGLGWECAAQGHSCYNIAIPREQGCPLGYEWSGQSCYKPCPEDYARLTVCSCRLRDGPGDHEPRLGQLRRQAATDAGARALQEPNAMPVDGVAP